MPAFAVLSAQLVPKDFPPQSRAMSTAEPPTIFGGNLEDGSLYGWVWILGKNAAPTRVPLGHAKFATQTTPLAGQEANIAFIYVRLIPAQQCMTRASTAFGEVWLQSRCICKKGQGQPCFPWSRKPPRRRHILNRSQHL